MVAAPNPYAPPAEGSAPSVDESALGELIEEHRTPGTTPATRWTVSFHREGVLAVRDDGQRGCLSRGQLVADTRLMLGLSANALVIERPTRCILRLTPEAVAALRRFLEPDLAQHLASTLKRQLALAVPFGLFITLTSVPWFGSSLDVGGVIVGIGMVALGLVARRSTGRWVLAADAVLWGVIIVNNLSQLGNGGPRWLALLFGLMGASFGLQALRLYKFYDAAPAR